MKDVKNPSKLHYYLSDNDTIWAEIDGKVHIYNYEKKDFILCNRLIDIMKWHEFPASELRKTIEETTESFGLNDSNIKEPK